MTAEKFKEYILHHLIHEPTNSQEIAIDGLVEYILSYGNDDIFILTGYAGTGKTTLISALVNALNTCRISTVLLAPTGRAAKILSEYSKQRAYTIHKKIYQQRVSLQGQSAFVTLPNLAENTIFIVDEASMIGDGSTNDFKLFGSGSLLDDLIEYVYGGIACKLILIGDKAQLPPVGMEDSPALEIEFLKHSFNLEVKFANLTDVVRQEKESGILLNATALRNLVIAPTPSMPAFNTKNFKDFIRLNGDELEDALHDSYRNYGDDGAIVVCRSNKRANLFNQQIRVRIRMQESEISSGDYMMVVRNNYYWLDKSSNAGFIANGDIIEIQKLKRIRDIYGFRFAEATVRMMDYPDEQPFETILLLDTINSEASSLSPKDQNIFFEEVMKDYDDIPERRRKFQKLKENPFYNALQVKFAYALTCHKAQGGQWPCIFVDQGYITQEMINKDYLRWLYTALTRATQKIYLINFKEEFFIPTLNNSMVEK